MHLHSTTEFTANGNPKILHDPNDEWRNVIAAQPEYSECIIQFIWDMEHDKKLQLSISTRIAVANWSN